MSHIAWLGLGAMGSRMVALLLKSGHTVAVYNRSAEKSHALSALGTQITVTPREAVQGAAFVFVMLRDDKASRSVWTDAATEALTGMSPGAVAIESSTLTPSWVRELGELVQAREVELLDAPVTGSRKAAEAGQLICLVGSQRAALDRVEPVLRAMGTAVHHAGPRGSGTLVKLMVNALYGVQVAAVAELLGLAQANGLDAVRALEILAATPMASPVEKAAGTGMLEDRFAPSFTVDLMAKDFGWLCVVQCGPSGGPHSDYSGSSSGAISGLRERPGQRQRHRIVQAVPPADLRRCLNHRIPSFI